MILPFWDCQLSDPFSYRNSLILSINVPAGSAKYSSIKSGLARRVEMIFPAVSQPPTPARIAVAALWFADQRLCSSMPRAGGVRRSGAAGRAGKGRCP